MSFIPAPLASLFQITSTPSREDGIPEDLEADLRMFGSQLIQEAGRLCKLPQVAMATAQVLFQRFWFVTSLKSFGIREIGMGALYLATKLEEHPTRLRDIVNVYDLLHHRMTYLLSASSPSSPSSAQAKFTYTPMSYSSNTFYTMKDAIVVAEMQILKRLGFNVQVQLPYATMVNYCQMLGLVGKEGVIERAWGLLNDSLQTSLPALYPPTTLASSVILLSTRQHSVALPDRWWELFDVEYADMVSVVGTILHLHERVESGEGRRAWILEGKGEVRAWLEKFSDLDP